MSLGKRSFKRAIGVFLFANWLVYFILVELELPFSYLFSDIYLPNYRSAIFNDLLFFVLGSIILRNFDLAEIKDSRLNSFGILGLILLLAELFLTDFGLVVYSDNFDKGSTLIELGSLLIVLSRFGTRSNRYLFFIGFLFVIFLTVINGKRMALSYFFMYFFYFFSSRLSLAANFLFLWVVLFGFTLTGFFREGEFDYIVLAENVLSSNNHGGVLHAAGMYDYYNSSLNFNQRGQLILYNLVLPLFVPLKYLPEMASVNLWFRNNFTEIQGNGGFFSVYLNFFFGKFYIFVLVAILFLLRKLKKYSKFILLFFFIISNRFFYYNIASSLRLMSLVLMCYLFLYISKQLIIFLPFEKRQMGS